MSLSFENILLLAIIIISGLSIMAALWMVLDSVKAKTIFLALISIFVITINIDDVSAYLSFFIENQSSTLITNPEEILVVLLGIILIVSVIVWLSRQSFSKFKLDKDSRLIQTMDSNKSDTIDNEKVYRRILLLVLFILMQSGLWYLFYESGYDEGHSIGYDEGYSIGYDEGKEVCGGVS